MLRFWFQLALALGIPVGELQQRMGLREFQYWQAYYNEEPFGEARGDLQTALLATVIANVNRGKRDKKAKLINFMPDYWGWKARNLGARIDQALRAVTHG